jgi:predicted dehydrogenase
MVGHIFRFHPVTLQARELLGAQEEIMHIESVFLNPYETDNGESPAFEFIHFIDLTNIFFGSKPSQINKITSERMVNIQLSYLRTKDADLKLGWYGEKRIRMIKIATSKKMIELDYQASCITIRNHNGDEQQIIQCSGKEPLELEIKTFLKVCEGKAKNPITEPQVLDAISIAEFK